MPGPQLVAPGAVPGGRAQEGAQDGDQEDAQVPQHPVSFQVLITLCVQVCCAVPLEKGHKSSENAGQSEKSVFIS